MRIDFPTKKPDEPLHFGFDLTPHFATLAFVEPEVLFLSKGLKVIFRGQKALVQGGPSLEVALSLTSGSTPVLNEEDPLASLADLVEKTVNAEILAIQNPISEMRALQPLVTVFRTEDRLISAEMVAEELLARMQALRTAALGKTKCKHGISAEQLLSSRERCAFLNDMAQDGHLTPVKLNYLLGQLSSVEPHLPTAFFISNLDDYCEGIRSAFLRSSYHMSRMTFALHEINKQTPLEFIVHDSELGTTAPRELRHFSKIGDSVADEFVSAALAAYSILDLTRKLFDFLIREPFGDPKRVSQQHFMDKLPAATPQYKLDLPMALPLVSKEQFKTLYLLRSDLIHNQGTDYMRPLIYWGVAQEPVNGQPLQYVQYMNRDVTVEGAASTHKWLARFFSQKRDAEAFLGTELIGVLQCAIQTVEWLTFHLDQTTRPSRTEENSTVLH
jgi:hypothetical protein